MKKYFSVISQTPLFSSINSDNLQTLLNCMGATALTIAKDGYVLTAGERPDHIGIVLLGKFQIIREDADGNRVILIILEPGDIYGETLVCAKAEQSPVSVCAVDQSVVLKLNFRRLLMICPNTCTFHTKLIQNMLALLARKNLVLQQRMELLDKKTIRERLLFYLYEQKKRYGASFTIPFNRNELAEHLAVDRSALSREMGKLRDEGVILFHKNNFEILE